MSVKVQGAKGTKSMHITIQLTNADLYILNLKLASYLRRVLCQSRLYQLKNRNNFNQPRLTMLACLNKVLGDVFT